MVSCGNTPQYSAATMAFFETALRYKGAGPFGSFLTTAISGVRNSRCSRSDMNLPSDLFQKGEIILGMTNDSAAVGTSNEIPETRIPEVLSSSDYHGTND